jgi:hypothetical protein
MFGFQPMGFSGGFAPQGFGGMYGSPPMMNMQFAPQGPQGFGGGFQGGFGGGFAPPPQFQPSFGSGMPPANDRVRSAPSQQGPQSAGPSDAEFMRNISGLSPAVQQQMLAERQRDQLPPGQRQFGPSTGPEVSKFNLYVDSGKPDQYRPSRRGGESPFGGGFAPPSQFQPNFGGGFGGGMGPQQPAFGGFGMPQGGGFGGFPPPSMSPYGGGPQFQPPAFGGGGMPQFGMPQPPQGRSFGMPGMEASPPFGGGPMPQFGGGGQRQPMFGGGGFGGGFQAPQFAMPQFGGLLGFGGGMPSNMGPQMPQQGGGQMGIGNFMQDQLRNAGMGPQRPQNKSMVEAASQQMQNMPPMMGDMRYRGGPMTAEQEAFGAQREQDMRQMMQMAGLNPGVSQTAYGRRNGNRE